MGDVMLGNHDLGEVVINLEYKVLVLDAIISILTINNSEILAKLPEIREQAINALNQKYPGAGFEVKNV